MNYYIAVAPEHIKKERIKAKELRASQWWKQKLSQGHCYYCEENFDKSELTMDHILAVARGGRSTRGNVVVSCKACNTKKRHLTPAEILLNEM